MALVTAHNLSRSFGAEDIFSGISVSVPHRARIALVGPNGVGKTTLLRLLAGEDEPTSGSVSYAKGLRIGLLPQEASLSLAGERTLWAEMLTVFEPLLAQEARLNHLAEELARRPDDTALLETYGNAQQRFEAAGGYEYATRIRKIVGGLGFDEDDYERPIEQLSGGQKTRALLARLLLEAPDLLILDEPTNHLDIQAIEWLESWLKNFEGALLMVSHDRYFMDALVDHVWEMIFGQVEIYRGSYSDYVAQREARHERLLKEYEAQQAFIAKEEDYIRRNIAGQNTRQAQGRRKRLERYMRDEAIRRPREQRFMRLALKAGGRSGDKVLVTEDLVVGYHDDGVPLFSVPDITLYRGECAALIGPNGTGKTTFLKTILGKLEPLQGRARLGASIEVGYFAQAHEGLHPDNTLIEEILSVQYMPEGEARSYLATFLFTGDDVYKQVKTLSGGERGRVALAKLALSGANVLLLDEPTNHLDIPSQEILEAVLTDYSGTILLVSHDRYLIRRLATQIWALRTERSGSTATFVLHEGPYDEYVSEREGQRPSTTAPVEPTSITTATPAAAPPDGRPQISAYERKRRLAKIERDIETVEIDLVNLSGALEAASAAGHVGEVAELGRAYTDAEARLENLLGEWEDLLVESS